MRAGAVVAVAADEEVEIALGAVEPAAEAEARRIAGADGEGEEARWRWGSRPIGGRTKRLALGSAQAFA